MSTAPFTFFLLHFHSSSRTIGKAHRFYEMSAQSFADFDFIKTTYDISLDSHSWRSRFHQEALQVRAVMKTISLVFLFLRVREEEDDATNNDFVLRLQADSFFWTLTAWPRFNNDFGGAQRSVRRISPTVPTSRSPSHQNPCESWFLS